MAEQRTAEQLVQQAPGETLLFDLPRVRVNPGPSAVHFQFQRRLRLLAKVPAACLHALDSGSVTLRGRVLAIDEGEVAVVVLLLGIGEKTLVTYLDVCGPGSPGPAVALRFALDGGVMLVRLCSLETGEWELRTRAIAVSGPFREEIERVDAYVQEKTQRQPWSPATFAQAQHALADHLSVDSLWQYPITPKLVVRCLR
jgi:hypothetical protein